MARQASSIHVDHQTSATKAILRPMMRQNIRVQAVVEEGGFSISCQKIGLLSFPFSARRLFSMLPVLPIEPAGGLAAFEFPGRAPPSAVPATFCNACEYTGRCLLLRNTQRLPSASPSLRIAYGSHSALLSRAINSPLACASACVDLEQNAPSTRGACVLPWLPQLQRSWQERIAPAAWISQSGSCEREIVIA
ncbi:hypothetical protein GQ43DRAFT_468751 [Delitschia confertaspora ATCC 74209]|uniref:Uncharacterized protein n=1 Tax=Delitschia confertaspora ATCC 74209 TaxID=1513339 RepID=A0A9P4JS96_9PLEO|nr:hypothetical protein GQ43DRAFT_468751 [Delitschia confertaspora ATCC 74209]